MQPKKKSPFDIINQFAAMRGEVGAGPTGFGAAGPRDQFAQMHERVTMGTGRLAGDPVVTPTGRLADNNLGRLANAITGVESGGNYSIVNPHSGARGRYQFMPATYKGVAKQLGFDPNDWSPATQDRAAQHLMGQYLKQFGDPGAVAVAWYGGPGAAAEWMRNRNASRFTRKQSGGHPSINEYVQKVLAAYGQ